jgi:hypothetical protein
MSLNKIAASKPNRRTGCNVTSVANSGVQLFREKPSDSHADLGSRQIRVFDQLKVCERLRVFPQHPQDLYFERMEAVRIVGGIHGPD